MKEPQDKGATLPSTDWPDRPASSSSSLPTTPAPRSALSTILDPRTVLAGKYRIERIIGTGGMGVVAAAHHLQLDRRVAIKYLLPEALEYPELIERFTREAQIAARIRSEHIARVIDVGTFDDGAPYIVLEYLDGVDLATHAASHRPLPIADVISYVLQTCEALAEAHAANVVHRDLKPANLFLAKQPDRTRTVKVLDFGISKIIGEALTTPSAVLGTVMYMSPEQLRSSGNVDCRTDIWSLGVIAYELLCGVGPFDGVTIVGVAEAVAANNPKPMRMHRPEIPDELEAAVARCLRTNPAERYESVLQLAIAIAPFAALRDRQSVRAIAGVLGGSIAPPPLPAHLGLDDPPFLPPPPRTASLDPAQPPFLVAPVAAASEAPTTLPTRPPFQPASGAGRSRTTWAAWLSGAALGIAVVILARFALAPAGHAAPPPLPVAPSEIVIHLNATTPSARVRIDDGPPVALPFEMTAPRDQREHRIHVEAEGHIGRTEIVPFTRDLTISVALQPLPSDRATDATDAGN